MKTCSWWLCAMSLWLAACGTPGGGNTGGGTGTTCPTPSGSGTLHSTAPTTDETWSAAGSPHVVNADLNIYNDVTVTVEPCAVVQLVPGAHLVFGDSVSSAHLVARGTATQPITFEPATAGTHWASLYFSPHATGDLAYVTLAGGAATSTALNYPATLMMDGDDNLTAPLRQVRVENVVITGAEEEGVEIIAAAGFTADSHDLLVTGSGAYGVRGEPLSVQTLPSGRYTGNAHDVVQVAIRLGVRGDLRFKDYGVPYVLEGSLAMLAPDATVITWTLDPGVTLKVPPTYGISLDDTGAVNAGSVKVIANGTDAQPITLTSAAASPAAGDWTFVDWESGTADSRLNHVIFEYGGAYNGHNGFGCGNSENRGLLMIHEWVPPAGLVQNSTFRHSAGGGIVSGWTDSGQLPDLTLDNTFEDYNSGSFCGVSKPEGTAECSTTNTPGDCYY